MTKFISIILFFIATMPLATNSYSATIYDYDATAYKYVNTDSTDLDNDGLFDNSAFSSNIKDAYFWSGPNTNISGENQDFVSSLNNFFANNTFIGDGPTSFSFSTAVKTSSDFQNPITSSIMGLLLKQAKGSLLVTFNTPVSQLYWSTLFVPQGGTGLDKISHYVLIDSVSEVPVPAAIFLFGPALLTFIGLRRRNKI